MQIQNDPSVERMLKNCQLIEANSEFLTVVRCCVTKKNQSAKNAMKTLSSYMQQKRSRINHQNFIHLLIEIAYFIFSCKHFGIKPEIVEDDIRVQQQIVRQNEKRFSPIIFYRLSEQKSIDPFVSLNILYQLYSYLFASYSKYMQFIEGEMNQNDIQFNQLILRFQKQYMVLIDNRQVFENNKQKEFFLCLEETNLFNDFSLLLKIKNCSILDLIKMNEPNLTKFKSFKNRDVNLVSEYNNQKKKVKNDHDSLRTKERQIDANITNFFKGLNQSENSMEQISNKGDKEQSYRVRFIYKIKQKAKEPFHKAIRKITKEIPEIIEEETGNQLSYPPSEMEYYVEYSSDRNSICVKLMTSNINVNVQTSDFLMFQSNVLTFDAANVSIELFQTKTADKNQAKKVLAFKGASCFNNKEPPLEKILLLMDITMISSKIYEPELNPARAMYCGMKDYQKLNLITRKVNHYTKMFLKCSKRVYNEC